MQIIKDPVLNGLLILNPQRQKRPEEKKGKIRCPFCKGNEDLTPKHVLSFPDDKNWKVRVIPNKFPVLPDHEVVIHTPEHISSFSELSEKNIRFILLAYKQRIMFFKEKYENQNLNVLIYCNQGFSAGASLEHSHSQILVLDSNLDPEFPPVQPVENKVFENDYFDIYCPEYSEWPYELWIQTKRNIFFEETDAAETDALSTLLKKIIIKLKKIHSSMHKLKIDFGYNWYIYPRRPWYLRIMPRFTQWAGLELASNIKVNTIPPKEAAKCYKEI